MSNITSDVVVFPVGEDRWIVMNVFSHRSMAMETAGLEVLRSAGNRTDRQLDEDFSGRLFTLWNVHRFSNLDGLLADPTNLVREVDNWPAPCCVTAAEFIEAARQATLFIDDEDAYRARFAHKESIFDRQNFGNFHEQMGQELLLGPRARPAEWWPKQKFTEDQTALQENLYKSVQGAFLEAYFNKTLKPGMNVIDLGCGNGFYANQMAKAGCTVTGADPNADYIAFARKNAAPGATFERSDIGEAESLELIPSHSADIVYMGDALLFYFVSPMPGGELPDFHALATDIRRILKPGGRFVSMEPHFAFWLAPWLGAVDRPFTILTEYQDRRFQVTPTIGETIRAFANEGFAVSWMEELQPDPSYQDIDPRGYHFARAFPVFQLMEFIPIDGPAGRTYDSR
jgi:SAM-dependent methyltransferase